MVARGRFDAARVTDETAHQAIKVMLMQLQQSLSAQETAAMQFALEDMGQPGSPAWVAVCDRLRGTSVPQHEPGYMVSHGIKAISGNGGVPLVSPFDAAGAWETVLTQDFSCPA